MPQLNPEEPRSADSYFHGTPISAYGGLDSGTLEKVRARIYQTTPPADPPDTTDPYCQEVIADMTGTFWEVYGLNNLQIGANQLGLWGYFTGTGWCRANPIPLTGVDNPMGGVPPGPPPGAGQPPGPPPGRGRLRAQAAAMAPPPAQPPAAAVMSALPAPLLAAGVGPLPVQFRLRVNRWRLSRFSDEKELLNGGLLQAAPIILNYDFGLSNLNKLVWSMSVATSLPEDHTTASKWILELPTSSLGAPGAMLALVYLQQVTGGTVKIDQWASNVFDPTAETRFLPHADIPDRLLVSPGP